MVGALQAPAIFHGAKRAVAVGLVSVEGWLAKSLGPKRLCIDPEESVMMFVKVIVFSSRARVVDGAQLSDLALVADRVNVLKDLEKELGG